MKNSVALFCLLLSFIPGSLFAQLIAGEVPFSYTLHESDLHIESASVIVSLDLIDLNFDGEDDLSFQIRKAADGRRTASVFPRADSIGICHVQGLNYTPAEIYEAGNSMECTDASGFDLDPALVGYGLGRYDNGTVEGFPAQITNGYLHYEWKTAVGAIEGWIKISFDLTEESIFLTVHEWIINDELSSTQILEPQEAVSLYPNPVVDGVLYYSSEQDIEHFEVYDLRGRLLRNGVVSDNEIPMNGLRGMVVVKLQTEKGTLSKKVFIE